MATPSTLAPSLLNSPRPKILGKMVLRNKCNTINFFDYIEMILTKLFQCFSKRHRLNGYYTKCMPSAKLQNWFKRELRSSPESFNTYQRVKGDNRANILVFMKRLHSAAIVALKRNVTFFLASTVCSNPQL